MSLWAGMGSSGAPHLGCGSLWSLQRSWAVQRSNAVQKGVWGNGDGLCWSQTGPCILKQKPVLQADVCSIPSFCSFRSSDQIPGLSARMVPRKIVEQKAKVDSLFSQLPPQPVSQTGLADDGFQCFIHGTCTMAQLFFTITRLLPPMGFYGNSPALRPTV